MPLNLNLSDAFLVISLGLWIPAFLQFVLFIALWLQCVSLPLALLLALSALAAPLRPPNE